MNITIDLFSALVDSRAGASHVLQDVAECEGWPLAGDELYTAWDRRHKLLQAQCRHWVPFTELGRRAMTEILSEAQLEGDVDGVMRRLWASVGDWPLWPDVEAGVGELAASHEVGLLSNVDDDLLARTRVARLPLAPDLLLTSERLHAYKPAPALYRAARAMAGEPYLHVASSARDVRGSLEAGLSVARLTRPGHHLDPDGPTPTLVVASLPALAQHLAEGRPVDGPR